MASDYSFYSVGPVVRSSPNPRHAIIQSELIVGEYVRPDDVPWLRSHLGVSTVLCLQDDIDLAGKALVLSELVNAYRDAGIQFHRTPVPDGEQEVFVAHLATIVDRLATLIAEGHTVYVHCNAGMNRAPTVAIAYLHAHGGMSLTAARDFVKQRHPCVPYMTMLERYYRQP